MDAGPDHARVEPQSKSGRGKWILWGVLWVFLAVAWRGFSVNFPMLAIIAGIALGAATISAFVPTVRAKVWGLVGKKPPGRPSTLQAVFLLTLALFGTWAGITQKGTHGRFDEALASARQHAADPASTEQAIADYGKAESLGKLPSDDALAYAKLLKAKGEQLADAGSLKDAIAAMQQAQQLSPEMNLAGRINSMAERLEGRRAAETAVQKQAHSATCATALVKEMAEPTDTAPDECYELDISPPCRAALGAGLDDDCKEKFNSGEALGPLCSLQASEFKPCKEVFEIDNESPAALAVFHARRALEMKADDLKAKAVMEQVYEHEMKCATRSAKLAERLLKRNDLTEAKDEIDLGDDCIINAMDAKPKDRTAKKVSKQLTRLRARKEKLANKAARSLVKRDIADLKRCLLQVRRQNWVAKIELADDGHQMFDIYVNHLWHRVPKGEKKEVIRIVEKFLEAHVSAHHDAIGVDIRIRDRSGAKIGGTGFFGVSAD